MPKVSNLPGKLSVSLGLGGFAKGPCLQGLTYLEPIELNMVLC